MFDEAFNISIVFDEVITSGTENCEYVTIAADEGGFSLQATCKSSDWEPVLNITMVDDDV